MNHLKWALRLVTHNFGWKVLALASAFAIWALVASEPELSTFTTVRLAYRNLPDNLEVSSAPMETVTLELRGPAGELRAGEARRPAVDLDMSGVLPGQRTFTIGDGNVALPRGVRLVRAIPSEVRFEFERRLYRSIAVQPQLVGQSKGYAIADALAFPDKLVIVGPASHVASVRAVVTDPVDITPVVGTSEFHVNAYVSDPFVRVQGSPQIVVSVTMKKKSRG